MPAETEPDEGGLSLSEARQSLVSPELRGRYESAMAAFEARERSYPGWRNGRSGYLDEYGQFQETPDPLSLEVARSRNACELEIQHRLANGDLLAWGARGSVAGERVPIRSLSWDKLRLDFGRSQIRARGKPPIVFFDVCLFEAAQLVPRGVAPLKRKPVTEAIHEALQRLKARGAHRTWVTKTEAQRAIRNEADGQGDQKNARKMVDEVLGTTIDQLLLENRTLAESGEMDHEGSPENKE